MAILMLSKHFCMVLSHYKTLGSNTVPSAPLHLNYSSWLQWTALEVGKLWKNQFILQPSTYLDFHHCCGTLCESCLPMCRIMSISPFLRKLQQSLGGS